MKKMQILWFILTQGDGRYVGTGIGGHAMTPEDLRQIAQAFNSMGHTGALLPAERFSHLPLKINQHPQKTRS